MARRYPQPPRSHQYKHEPGAEVVGEGLGPPPGMGALPAGADCNPNLVSLESYYRISPLAPQSMPHNKARIIPPSG